MQARFTLTTNQYWFIERLRTLYPKKDGGLCHGLASTAMYYIFRYGLNQFDHRLNLIHSIPTNEFADRINTVKLKVKTKETLNEEDKDVLNIFPFFEKIIFFQNASQFPHWFEKGKEPVTQIRGEMAARQLFASQEFEDIVSICRISGVYTENELTIFFTLLKNLTLQTNVPIAFMLCQSRHTIILSYDLNMKSFALVDANHLPTMYFNDPKELAMQIKKCFFVPKKKCDAISMFYTTIYTTQSNEAVLQKCIKELAEKKEWKEIHKITKTKAQAVDVMHVTWLYLAAQIGDYRLAKTLLEVGADVNATLEKGMSSLFIAAQEERIEIAELLLQYGAKVDHPNQGIYIPLHIAVHQRNVQMIELLLKHGAQVDQAKPDSIFPLYAAAHEGHAEVTKLLLANGASIDQLSNTDASALLIAANNGHTEVVKLLLQHNAKIVAEKNGYTPLLLAAKKGYIEIVKLLLQHGDNVNQSRKYRGESALFIAAIKGHVEIVKTLLLANADREICFLNSPTGMREFASKQDEKVKEAMEAFLEKHQPMTDGRVAMTAKDIAIIMGHDEIIQLLQADEKKNSANHNTLFPQSNQRKKRSKDVISSNNNASTDDIPSPKKSKIG